MIRFLLHRARTRSLLLAACETVLMVGAVVLAAIVRVGYDGAADILLSDNGPARVLLVVAIAQISLYYVDLYDFRVVLRACGPVLLGAEPDGGPRRVLHCRRPADHRHRRLAAGVRMDQRARGSARAAAARRHQSSGS